MKILTSVLHVLADLGLEAAGSLRSKRSGKSLKSGQSGQSGRSLRSGRVIEPAVEAVRADPVVLEGQAGLLHLLGKERQV